MYIQAYTIAVQLSLTKERETEMKKFIALITLVSLLSCASCGKKDEGSTSKTSSSSSSSSNSVAENSVAEDSSVSEDSATEESSTAETSSDGEYEDWYGLHMWIPTELHGKKPLHTSSSGYPTWYRYDAEFTEGNNVAVSNMIGYSRTTTGAAKDGSEVPNEEALESFFDYEVSEILGEAYGFAHIRERVPEKTETVTLLDKDFIRESGTMHVSTMDTVEQGGFDIYYVCYVGTPGFKDSLFAISPCIWIAFCDNEADKDAIAEMVDKAADNLSYTE